MHACIRQWWSQATPSHASVLPPCCCHRRALDLPDLEQLVQRLDSAAVVRSVLTERRIEAARSEMGAAAAGTCCVCCEAPRDTVLSCGHIICRRCSDRLSTCPVCRAAILSRTRAFV